MTRGPRPSASTSIRSASSFSQFSTTGTAAGSYHLTATIGQGGRLDLTGTIRAQPVSLHGTLKLDDLSARDDSDVSRSHPARRDLAGQRRAPGQLRDRQRVRRLLCPECQDDHRRAPGRGERAGCEAAAGDLGLRAARPLHSGQRSHRSRRSAPFAWVEIALAGADVRGWLDERGQLNLLQLLGTKRRRTGRRAAAAPPPAAHAPAWRIAAPDIRDHRHACVPGGPRSQAGGST